jgi:hypothetical protein
MAFNFPNSPTEGQEFIAPNGFVYKYIAPVWTLLGTGGSQGATGPQGPAGPTGANLLIADTAPTGQAAGTMWWSSLTGNLYVYYNDGTSSQWVQINTVGS